VLPIELVNAYATFAAGGFYAPPLLVLRVRDRNGQVLEENPPVPPPPMLPPPFPTATAIATQTPTATSTAPATPTATATAAAIPAATEPAPQNGIRPEVAYVLVSMMRDVVEYGTGAAAKALARPLAAKTGTTQEHRDAWFVGFSPDLVAGVWVGFDSHEPLGGHATGAGAALPAWLGFMQAAVGGRPIVDFQVPPGVEFARIDPRTGWLSSDPAPADGAAAPLVPFIAGTAPAQRAPDPGTAPQSFFQDDP
jgi:penicillin-binding protein 1A